jgi:hypothetical protein
MESVGLGALEFRERHNHRHSVPAVVRLAGYEETEAIPTAMASIAFSAGPAPCGSRGRAQALVETLRAHDDLPETLTCIGRKATRDGRLRYAPSRSMRITSSMTSSSAAPPSAHPRAHLNPPAVWSSWRKKRSSSRFQPTLASGTASARAIPSRTFDGYGRSR